MNHSPTPYKTYFALALLLLAIAFIHYGVERHETVLLLSLYSLSFLSYIYVLRSQVTVFQIIAVGILARASLFFAIPNLSEDVFRFIWDGRLMHAGLHPFSGTPEQIIANGSFTGYDTTLYALLNSKGYFTIYPPISQLIFWLSTFSSDIFTNVTTMRLILFGFEAGNIYLLNRYFNPKKKGAKLAIYVINPLVILELTGNLHFEGVMIFFVLLSIVMIRKNKWLPSSAALALSIGTKFIPLMFLPALIKHLKWRKALWSYFTIGAILIIITIPLYNLDLFLGMYDSLLLFFNKFEFNGGLFFLIREIGFLTMGYDVIQTMGPLFSIISLSMILWYCFKKVTSDSSLTKVFSVLLFIQLAFATTVHPWYIIPLIAFAVSSGYIFPIVWSYFIFMTYAGYSKEGFVHPMIWITIEYVIVGLVALYEFKMLRLNNNKQSHP